MSPVKKGYYMPTEKLNACPHCGSNEIMLDSYHCLIACRNCPSQYRSTEDITEAKLINGWNRRAKLVVTGNTSPNTGITSASQIAALDKIEDLCVKLPQNKREAVTQLIDGLVRQLR